MAKYPLNKFKSIYKSISATNEPYFVYEAQNERATILLNCQASNTTDKELTISLYISAGSTSYTSDGIYSIVKNVPIPPYDARALVTGRLVLRGQDGTYKVPDSLFVQAPLSGIDLSLGLLEAVNKD